MARVITWRHAMYEGIQQEMRRDETVLYMGETIRSYAISKAPDGSIIDLTKEFGEERVRDTAIAETAIIGMGVGAAMAGSRPICEILFADFLGVAFDEIFNQAAVTRYTTGGQATVPMVIKVGLHGAAPGLASQHAHAGMECLFAHSPGLKIA
ncbi:MAG: alpha-ketoacid dehydrogenase subunit beta, partial [Candidatus Hydrogenedentota bacterium]